MSRRLYYIDWLRVLAVLLLLPFHTSRVFNFGEDFYVKAEHLSKPLGYALGFISMWHMQLLFLLAGASAYFSLRRRTAGQFSLERVQRLLVPFVFGIFVIIPPQTWIGGQFNSGYTSSFLRYITSGDFLAFNVRDGGDYYGGFGIGHLWFVFFLFVLSLAALPLLLWGRTERGAERLRRFARLLARPVWWLLPAFLILVGEALPEIPGGNPFYYLVFFVLGYVIMCDDSFIESAEKHWPWVFPLGLAACAWWDGMWWWRDTLPDPSVTLAGVNYLGMLGTWLAIVGLLGAGKHFLDRPSPTLSYLAESSYPVYILHQTVIVVAAFYLLDVVGGAAWLQWLVVLVTSVVGTFVLYEVVRRVGPLRALFGMRAKTKAQPART